MSSSSLKTVVRSVKHWYIPLIIAILLILTGVYVLSIPVASYLALSILFSLSFLVSGILQISFSIANKDELDSWGWHLAAGILYALFGLLLLARPGISITTLPFVVGFYALFQSVNALGWAVDLRNMGIKGWGYVATMGVVGIIVSFILIWNPLFAGLTLVAWTGLAFIMTGISGILLSMKLKQIKDLPGNISDELKKRIESLKKEYQDAINKRDSGRLRHT